MTNEGRPTRLLRRAAMALLAAGVSLLAAPGCGGGGSSTNATGAQEGVGPFSEGEDVASEGLEEARERADQGLEEAKEGARPSIEEAKGQAEGVNP
jgi:hypothetical protein